MAINLKNKKDIIKKFGKDAKDSGSAEVQIALLTQKITELTEHLKINKKDFQGKRGLLMMVGQRKRLLAYVKNRDLQKYRDLIKALGIRG
jgi:small subunit ribosomal protein S15